MSWIGFVHRTLTPEQFAEFTKIHERNTAPAPVCPFIEVVMSGGTADLMPMHPRAETNEVRAFGITGLVMYRSETWDRVPESPGRGHVKVRGVARGIFTITALLTGEIDA